ncbi:MAG: GTPase Era [Sphingopyxis sp.]|jgi:GTP-binding protein Era|uniref:GTPase Era n=1 Tax=Sphingopyxis TaxID=165697 RepID=UPI0006FC794D|nr:MULTISPECIES: GTPase Era [unclassified Sphingopyxis]KQZ71785.1 GTPase Era [Sphingopyxis sp. Root154]KRC05693.1 GTPase Era [Sphingopyxis sp. Root214]KTE02223.1 GTPase Era [Sphingopyxis sp. H012]KTE09971.1 GTPase Era [Sphingopyxis sp. H053]KTE15368.1 GTPase Era [Sphingopyxis sp. H093]
MTHRCGFVAVVGAPNAGKSTIVNALVGQKVAIVSPKAQTTRTRLMGVAMDGETQIVLIDTPGIFAPTRRLDRAMVAAAWNSLDQAEAILVMIDAAAKLGERAERVLQGIEGRPEKKFLVLNKVDLTKKDKLLTIATQLNERVKFDETFFISASTGDGVPELKATLAALMPEGHWHFPEDEVSDAPERMLAAEITREQLYRQLHEELPYQSTVETEKFTTRPDGSAEIHQQILVARDNQRAIILGHKGERIKEIGSKSRAELTELLGRKVHLFLHVKVKANWDEDRGVYRDMGLDWVD